MRRCRRFPRHRHLAAEGGNGRPRADTGILPWLAPLARKEQGRSDDYDDAERGDDRNPAPLPWPSPLRAALVGVSRPDLQGRSDGGIPSGVGDIRRGDHAGPVIGAIREQRDVVDRTDRRFGRRALGCDWRRPQRLRRGRGPRLGFGAAVQRLGLGKPFVRRRESRSGERGPRVRPPRLRRAPRARRISRGGARHRPRAGMLHVATRPFGALSLAPATLLPRVARSLLVGALCLDEACARRRMVAPRERLDTLGLSGGRAGPRPRRRGGPGLLGRRPRARDLLALAHRILLLARLPGGAALGLGPAIQFERFGEALDGLAQRACAERRFPLGVLAFRRAPQGWRMSRAVDIADGPSRLRRPRPCLVGLGPLAP